MTLVPDMASASAMSGVRTYLQRHAGLVALLLALTLALRALIPAGYMASASSNGVTIELCSGVAGKSVTIALPGTSKHQQDSRSQAEQPCSFSGAGFDSAATIDPLILAIAIAFVIALGVRSTPFSYRETPAYLRPPLRGPPHA